MSSISVIRKALADTLASSVQGLNTSPKAPDVAHPPHAFPLPKGCDFAKAFGRGLDKWDVDLVVLIARADSVHAQDQLDQYITGAGAKSIRQALYQNADLGLGDTTAFARGVGQYGAELVVGKVAYVGAVVKVEIHTDGSQ